ncbi:MAG: glycosyltransferase family 9 protein [Nitrospinota bacterium]
MNTIKLNDRPKILVVRTDRIGDLILTIPLFKSIKSKFPASQVAVLARTYTSDLLSMVSSVNNVISFESTNNHIPYRKFPKLIKEINNFNFDLAIIVFSNFTVGLLLALSNIKYRIGPATKIAQLFLTHKIKQNRSKSLKHEAIHNLELLHPLNIDPITDHYLELNSQISFKKKFQFNNDNKIISIYPGSAGSASNWKKERYIELIETVSQENINIVITGGPNEESLVNEILSKSKVKNRNVVAYINRGSLREFATVLQNFDLFFGPSTGPLHLASALKVPTVSIYPPIFGQRAERWGPLGEQNTIFTLETNLSDNQLKKRSKSFSFLDLVTPEMVKEKIIEKLQNKNGHLHKIIKVHCTL